MLIPYLVISNIFNWLSPFVSDIGNKFRGPSKAPRKSFGPTKYIYPINRKKDRALFDARELPRLVVVWWSPLPSPHYMRDGTSVRSIAHRKLMVSVPFDYGVWLGP